MKYSVVIPCAGSGTRMGLGYNKVLYKIGEETIIERTVRIFKEDPRCEKIVLVISQHDELTMKELFNFKKIVFAMGGETREESVYNGIKQVNSKYVLIHDGARPYLSKDLLNVILEVLDKNDVVAPFLKSKDALYCQDPAGKKFLPNVVLVQTPQAMKTSHIKNALSKAKTKGVIKDYKDDISVIEDMLNISPYLVKGEYSNIKITTIDDIK
jgi:2-C-methyl-D-erythritol 4-phosphate cytidylyltransferase